MKIILASASPRRREMLEQIGVPFSVRVSDIEEIADTTDPELLCQSLSRQKAEAVADQIAEEQNPACADPKSDRDGRVSCAAISAAAPEPVCVIGADTIVSVKGEILGKPKNPDDARRMAHLLSGATHQVFTGVTLIVLNGPDGREIQTFADRTDVTICPIPDDAIASYIQTTEPYDKAGGYAVQGIFGRYITRIDGDYNNVKGLPVGRLWREYLAGRI